MSVATQQSWANEKTPFFLSNPVQYLQISGTPPINLTNNAGTLEVNGVPIQTEPVSNWSLYPTLSNKIFLNPTNVIQLIGNDLYFNTEIIATQSNISNVADWYLYPALSNVQLNTGVGINFGNPPALSNLLYSSNGTLWFGNSNLVTNNWSVYPAISSVNMCNYNISNVQNIYACNIFGREDISLIANEPLNVVTYADVNLNASGGNRGRINLTADAGLLGVGGEVHIVANGGTQPEDPLVSFGGLIELTANTPIGTNPVLTSAIKFSAAGINSYAGAIPSVGSLAGYNFIYGNVGVNICAGVPSIIPNFPLTTYIYGTGGVSLESGLGADVKVRNSTLAVNSIKPDDLTYSNLIIRGRVNIVPPNQYVQLEMVRNIEMSNGGIIDMSNGNISNLCNINGSAYIPTTAWAGYPATTNVNMSNYSISNLTNINGVAYTPTCNWASSPAVANVNMCNFSISNLSNLNGSPYVPTSNWASYPASQSVNLSNFDISNVVNINGVAYSPTCNWATFTATSSVGMSNQNISNISQATFGAISNVSIQKGAYVLGSVTAGQETLQILNSLGGTGNLRVEQIAFQNNGGASNDTVLSQVLDALNPPRLIVDTNVSPSNIVAYLSDVQFRPSNDIYVAPNGNDITGNGSASAPFLTIGQAINYRNTLSLTTEMSILVLSGTYTENFTVGQNTYVVGIQTGEARQPVNVVGVITMNGTTGTIGLSGLEITGGIDITGNGATYTIFGCNITAVTNQCVAQTQGTVFITECRMTGDSTGSSVFTATGGSTTLRDCVITTSTGAVCMSASSSITIRQSVITSTSTSATANALVRCNGTSQNVEITFSKINYTSTTTDTGGNKCCIQFANSSGTITAQVSNCILDCVGASTGGTRIECIQKTGAGTVNLTYGDIQTINPASFIATGITKIPMIPADVGVYGCFASSITTTVTGANTPTTVNHNIIEVNGNSVLGLLTGNIVLNRAGNYEVSTSIQFSKSSGGSDLVYFWLRLNGTDVVRSGSSIRMTGNGSEILGNITSMISANAGDVLSVVFGSADATVQALATGAQTTPMVVPAIPSVITSVKLLN